MLIDFGLVFFQEIEAAVAFDMSAEAATQAACPPDTHIIDGTIRQVEFADIRPHVALCPNRQGIGYDKIGFKRIAAMFESLLKAQAAFTRHCPDNWIHGTYLQIISK